MDTDSKTLNASLLRQLYTKYIDKSSHGPSMQQINSALSNHNLLQLTNLRSLCHWDKKLLEMLERNSHTSQPICYISLPFIVSLMANKTNCDELVEADVHTFMETMLKCYSLQRAGILYALAEEHKAKPEIINLLNKNSPIKEFIQLKQVKENWCFWKNLVHAVFEHILDREFISNEAFMDAKVSFALSVSYLIENLFF